MSDIIKIKPIENRIHPQITRGDRFLSSTGFEVTSHNLGRCLVDVLAELPSSIHDTPRRFEQRVRSVALSLADEQPPLSTEMSWAFYDGVRERLEDRSAENDWLTYPTATPETTAAQTSGGAG